MENFEILEDYERFQEIVKDFNRFWIPKSAFSPLQNRARYGQ